MLEAKDQGHKAQVFSKKKKKKKKVFTKIFQAISKKKKKKVFTKIFQAISTKKRFPKNFSSATQNFNIPKNRAVLEPRTGQFSRTWGLEAKAKDLTFEAKAKDFKICPEDVLEAKDVLEDSTSGNKHTKITNLLKQTLLTHSVANIVCYANSHQYLFNKKIAYRF